MNKGRFVLGALVGAAAGVVAGILTAPQSGEETRADLKARAFELKEEAARRAEEMKVGLHGSTDSAEDSVEAAHDDTSEKK